MPTFDQFWNPGRPHWNLHRSQPQLDRLERSPETGFLPLRKLVRQGRPPRAHPGFGRPDRLVNRQPLEHFEACLKAGHPNAHLQERGARSYFNLLR